MPHIQSGGIGMPVAGLVRQTTHAHERFAWTPERVDELRRLWCDEGWSAGRIALQFGVTRNSIIGKVSGLNLTRDRHLPSVTMPGYFAPKGHKTITNPAIRTPVQSSQDIADTEAAPLPDKPRGAASFPTRQRKADGTLPPLDPDHVTEIAPDDVSRDRACTILELTLDTCRWPLGDPHHPGFLFCGQPPLADLPYCGAHCRRAYTPRRAA